MASFFAVTGPHPPPHSANHAVRTRERAHPVVSYIVYTDPPIACRQARRPCPPPSADRLEELRAGSSGPCWRLQYRLDVQHRTAPHGRQARPSRVTDRQHAAEVFFAVSAAIAIQPQTPSPPLAATFVQHPPTIDGCERLRSAQLTLAADEEEKSLRTLGSLSDSARSNSAPARTETVASRETQECRACVRLVEPRRQVAHRPCARQRTAARPGARTATRVWRTFAGCSRRRAAANSLYSTSRPSPGG